MSIRNWNFHYQFVMFSSFYSFSFVYQGCYFVLTKESWNLFLIIFVPNLLYIVYWSHYFRMNENNDFFSYFFLIPNMISEQIFVHYCPIFFFGDGKRRIYHRFIKSFGTLDSTHSKRSQMNDSRSPYFLYNGDHLGFNLVSYHLMSNNYNTWSWVMTMALNVKSKLGFIDSTISWPSTTNLLFDAWSFPRFLTSWLMKLPIAYFTSTPLWRLGKISMIGFNRAMAHTSSK